MTLKTVIVCLDGDGYPVLADVVRDALAQIAALKAEIERLTALADGTDVSFAALVESIDSRQVSDDVYALVVSVRRCAEKLEAENERLKGEYDKVLYAWERKTARFKEQNKELLIVRARVKELAELVCEKCKRGYDPYAKHCRDCGHEPRGPSPVIAQALEKTGGPDE